MPFFPPPSIFPPNSHPRSTIFFPVRILLHSLSDVRSHTYHCAGNAEIQFHSLLFTATSYFFLRCSWFFVSKTLVFLQKPFFSKDSLDKLNASDGLHSVSTIKLLIFYSSLISRFLHIPGNFCFNSMWTTILSKFLLALSSISSFAYCKRTSGSFPEFLVSRMLGYEDSVLF